MPTWKSPATWEETSTNVRLVLLFVSHYIISLELKAIAKSHVCKFDLVNFCIFSFARFDEWVKLELLEACNCILYMFSSSEVCSCKELSAYFL